ncbi:MAG: hypothetical protein ABI230_08295 [Aestuariivirga sp.]
MRSVLTLIILVLLGPQCKAETLNIYMVGMGQGSCAKWLSTPALEIQGNDWILGFWTGSNLGTSSSGGSGITGHTTDAYGIIGEVKKRCINSPSQLLGGVAAGVFNEFAKANR